MKSLIKNSIVIGLVVSFVFGFIGPRSALAAGPATVNLGTAGNFVILAKTGVSTVPNSVVTGNIGVSPVARIGLTGWSLITEPTDTYFTSAQVVIPGKLYAADNVGGTTSIDLTTAVHNMEAAYTDAAGRAPSSAATTNVGAGTLAGLTLVPGVYTWGSNVTIPTDLTLSGSANDVWIFQITGNLDISSAKQVILSGGAQASNIFWVVAGQTTIGTTAVFNGNILDQTTIVLRTGATLNGRALAQAAVTLDSNTVTKPTYTAPAPCGDVSGITCPYVEGLGWYPTSTLAISATPATPGTNAVLQAQLNGLLATLQSLQAQRAAQLGSSAPASNFGQQVKAIATNFTVGSNGSGVNTLQQFLISQNKGPATQALSKHGTTTHFGALTSAALAEFQKSVGITPASGYFGAKTRAYLKANY